MKLPVPLPSLAALPFLSPHPGVAADKRKNGAAEIKIKKSGVTGKHQGEEGKGGLGKSGPVPAIVGGEPVPINTYPWFARIGGGGCGASLISRQYLLTAAHCIDGDDHVGTVAQVGAFFGAFVYDYYYDDSENGGQEMESLEVVAQVMHPLYDDSTFDFDFALLKLNATVSDNTAPVPIDGHDGSSVVDGYGEDKTHLFAIGFGRTSDGGRGSDVLLHVDLDFVPQDQCRANYGEDQITDDYYDYGNYEITDAMMCAADTGQDSCHGDSGGPLWDRDEGVLVGVVSWGYECADPDYPGVYARISAVFPWIQRQVCAGTDDPASDPFCQGGSFAPTSSPYPTNLPTTPFPTWSPYTWAPTATYTWASTASRFPTRSPTDSPAPTGAPIVCPESTIKVAILTDPWPEETSWELVREGDGVIIASKDYYVLPETLHEHVYCVPMEAYSFTIWDSYGDGLFGGYEVFMDGDVVASGGGDDGGFTFSESTTFGLDPTTSTSSDSVDVNVEYHALESGTCAAPVWKRDQCRLAASATGREWKGAIANPKKPYGCLVIGEDEEVAFNVRGNKMLECKSHHSCMCAAPYALEGERCDGTVTMPLDEAACEEAAAAGGDMFVWEGLRDTDDKPRGCFVKVKRNMNGKIKGGKVFFNERGNPGTQCKWGLPCVCSI